MDKKESLVKYHLEDVITVQQVDNSFSARTSNAVVFFKHQIFKATTRHTVNLNTDTMRLVELTGSRLARA
jgi:hypothetical protein